MYRGGLDRFKKAQSLEPFSVALNSTPSTAYSNANNQVLAQPYHHENSLQQSQLPHQRHGASKSAAAEVAVPAQPTFQALMMVGIKNTSRAIASAMPNLALGIIFIIAACFSHNDFKIHNNQIMFVQTQGSLTSQLQGIAIISLLLLLLLLAFRNLSPYSMLSEWKP